MGVLNKQPLVVGSEQQNATSPLSSDHQKPAEDAASVLGSGHAAVQLCVGGLYESVRVYNNKPKVQECLIARPSVGSLWRLIAY